MTDLIDGACKYTYTHKQIKKNKQVLRYLY